MLVKAAHTLYAVPPDTVAIAMPPAGSRKVSSFTAAAARTTAPRRMQEYPPLQDLAPFPFLLRRRLVECRIFNPSIPLLQS